MAKFFRRGVSKIYFLPAVASLAAPTTIEVDAGEDLSAAVADIGGFSIANSPIPIPDLDTIFTKQINGEDTVDDSSLTFNDDDADDTVRTTLAKGTTGFIVLMPYGREATARCEVWPVVVTGFNDQWSLGNDPAQAVCGFAITGTPEQDAVQPALT